MSTLPREPVAAALRRRAIATPEHVFAVGGDGTPVTCLELARRSAAMAGWLRRQAIAPGERLVSAIGSGMDHVALFLACCLTDTVWVPVNPQTRGPALAHILETADPKLIVHEDGAAELLLEATATAGGARLVARSAHEWTHAASGGGGTAVDESPQRLPDLDRLRCVIFTSGTTGPPKGVMVTERMLLAAATATGLASRCQAGDRFLMWEPLHHIGGSQLCVLALLEPIRLHLVARFSASRFWDQVREFGITKLHYLGGVLDILLTAPESPGDRDHPARLAFGAGARPATWQRFSERFGIPLHEVYGMTEASSFTTLNDEGVAGSVGRALPWFDLELVDPDGNPTLAGPGELTVNAREPGLLTPGYLGNATATRELLRGGRLFTGDLMRRDDAGRFWYVGRRGDAIRRRGENLSAWEIEQALLLHPGIAEAAVVGVDATIGEQDVHAFVRARGDGLTFESLLAWCREHLGRHQVPRYFSFVDDFPRTPSERIAKSALERNRWRTWDSEDPACSLESGTPCPPRGTGPG